MICLAIDQVQQIVVACLACRIVVVKVKVTLILRLWVSATDRQAEQIAKAPNGIAHAQ